MRVDLPYWKLRDASNVDCKKTSFAAEMIQKSGSKDRAFPVCRSLVRFYE